MKSRPIDFRANEVNAILSGAKTQMRRIARPPAKAVFLPDDRWVNDVDEPGTAYLDDESGRLRIKCQHGKPGDQLWVREAFRAVEDPGADKADVRRKYRDEDGETVRISVDYRADGGNRIMDKIGKPEWQSPIFMPKWVSRIALEIIGVKIERVNEISAADAIDEGITFEGKGPDDKPRWTMYGLESLGQVTRDPAFSYRCLWKSIHGWKAWDANPWVWAITFRLIKRDA
jgi:hypothetical protein